MQWQWQEETKTFLVILHFDAVFSKTTRNLRIKKSAFWRVDDMYGENVPMAREYTKNLVNALDPTIFEKLRRLSPEERKMFGDSSKISLRNVISWAPTHIEIGVLGELLLYANIINGFKEERKRRLRYGLDFWVDREEMKRFDESFPKTGFHPNVLPDTLDEHFKVFDVLYATLKEDRQIITTEKDAFCIELCPEYIEYLKKIILRYS